MRNIPVSKKVPRLPLYKALKVAEVLLLDRYPDTDGLRKLAPGATRSGCTESWRCHPELSALPHRDRGDIGSVPIVYLSHSSHMFSSQSQNNIAG